jgi:protein-tyrosine-phosphatase
MMAIQRVLFLCTGNYYRSRYAEELFNHLARAEGLGWRAFSDADKVAAIVAARAAGAGVRRIARELGVGVGTVLQVIGAG